MAQLTTSVILRLLYRLLVIVLCFLHFEHVVEESVVIICLQAIAEGGCCWCWRKRSPLASKVAPVDTEKKSFSVQGRSSGYKRLNVDVL